MKQFLILLFVVVASTVDYASDKAKHALKECIGDRDELKFHDLPALNHLPTDNEEVLKVLECYWKKLGFIENDQINYDALRAAIGAVHKAKFGTEAHHEEGDNILKTCRTEVESSNDPLGLRGAKLRNCFLKYAEEHKH